MLLLKGHTESGTQERAEGNTGSEGLRSLENLNVIGSVVHVDANPTEKLRGAAVGVHSHTVGLPARFPW